MAITGLTLDPKTGVFSYTVVVADHDGLADTADYATYPGPTTTERQLACRSTSPYSGPACKYTVTKTCTGSAT